MEYDSVIHKIEASNIFKLKDAEFIVYEIILHMTSNVKIVKKFLHEGKTTFVYPLLRQNYEYFILAIALKDRLISVIEFMNIPETERKNKNIVEIAFKAILKAIRIKSVTDYKTFEGFCRSMKKYLNEQTHGSFYRLLRFTLERDDLDLIRKIEYRDALLLSQIFENMYISITNSILNTNFEYIKIEAIAENLLNDLKKKITTTSNIYTRWSLIDDVQKYFDKVKKTIFELKTSNKQFFEIIKHV